MYEVVLYKDKNGESEIEKARRLLKDFKDRSKYNE